MSRRYTDPVAQVVITDRDTGHEWHWGSPELPFLSSVSFVNDLGAIPVFSVGVDIPYDYMLSMTMARGTPFKQGNTLRARIGYMSGGWTPWMEGSMLNGGKGLSIGPDGVSGSLEVSWMTKAVAECSIPFEVLKAAKMDFAKLLEVLASTLGFGFDITDQAAAAVNAYSKSFADAEDVALEGKKGSKTPGPPKSDPYASAFANKTVFDTIKAICTGGDCAWWLEFKPPVAGVKTLFVATRGELSKGEIRNKRAPFKYVVRGILNDEIGQFPCDSFEPASDATSWLARGAGGGSGAVEVAVDVEFVAGIVAGFDSVPAKVVKPPKGFVGFDIFKKSESDISAEGVLERDDVPVSDIVGGVVVDIDAGGRAGASLSMPLRTNDMEYLKLAAESFMKEGDPGLAGTINTIGVPEEEVGQLCELRGCGPIFDSSFYIERIEHSWVPGNWTMKLGVHRFGDKAKGGKQVEAAGGQVTK